MTSDLVVLVGDPEGRPDLLEALEQLGAFTVRTAVSVEAAIEMLTPAPAALLLADLEVHERSGLEVLGALDALALQAPVLVSFGGEVRSSGRPRSLAPGLTLIEQDPTTDALRDALLEVIEASSSGIETPRFRVLDYVQLAVLAGLSVDLRLHGKQGRDLAVQVVGGDVWNAFFETLSGEQALGEMLLEVPDSVAARPLATLPKGRHVRAPGEVTLARLASELVHAEEELPARLSGDTDLPTKPDDPFAALDLAAGAGLDAPASTADLAPSTGNGFDSLLADGLRAALARDYEQAEECFALALRARPGDPRAQYNLVRVRTRLVGGDG